MSVHASLTGADLHEPKGVATASAGQVYLANGLGSGSWIDLSTAITNTFFTTGDLKLTYKVSADAGWVFYNEGSIGDASSSATLRANADTESLFKLIWDVCSNTNAPVSGGRGATAAADFAAHKRITLPLVNGRALNVAGQGTNLNFRTLGSIVGEETTTLTYATIPANIPQTLVFSTGVTGSVAFVGSSGTTVAQGDGASTPVVTGTIFNAALAMSTSVVGGMINPDGGAPFSRFQPSVFVNMMIKL